MNSKIYIIAIACLIGGLAGGFLTANSFFQNQLAVYERQIQTKDAALNATLAQLQVKDALIQSQLDQIQAQESLIQANTDQIQAMNLAIEQLKALTESQNEMIQLLLGS